MAENSRLLTEVSRTPSWVGLWIPALFAAEGERGEIARIGSINRIREDGRNLILDFTYDPRMPGIPNEELPASRHDLGIGGNSRGAA